jgi:Protein of unknown function (DUF5663)
MLKIDNSLLQDVGLGDLPAGEKNSFLKHIYETLEMRVGIRLADQMSNQQLDEFERYFEAKDDAGAFKWLETNFPNYKDIVQQEFDKLKTEVARSAPQILSASQQAAQAQPAVAPAPQQAQIAPPPAPAPQPPVAAQPQPAPQSQPYQPPQPPVAPMPPAPQAPPQAAPAFPQQPMPPSGFDQQPPQPASQPPFPQQQPPAGPTPL